MKTRTGRPRAAAAVASIGDNCVDLYRSPCEARYPGGCAVNVAVYLARAGVRSSYLGWVGDDEQGRFLTERLRSEGVDVSKVKAVPGRTGTTDVLVESGERVFVGMDLGVQTEWELTDADLGFLRSCDAAHYTGFTSWYPPEAFTDEWAVARVRRDLERLRAAVPRLAMDYAETPVRSLLAATAGMVECAFVSHPSLADQEVPLYLEHLAALGFRLAVLTRGDKGSFALDPTAGNGGPILHQPAYKVKPIDTLGAGDSFIGYFLARWAEGRPLAECLRAGARVAAQVCLRVGAW